MRLAALFDLARPFSLHDRWPPRTPKTKPYANWTRGTARHSVLAEVRVLTSSTPCLWRRGVINADVIRAENLPDTEREAVVRDGYIVGAVMETRKASDSRGSLSLHRHFASATALPKRAGENKGRPRPRRGPRRSEEFRGETTK
jgi:hypothetical protein